MKAMLIATLVAFGASTFATVVPSQAASVTITTRDNVQYDNGNHHGWYKKKRFNRDRDRGCEVRRQVVWQDGERIVRTVRECYR